MLVAVLLPSVALGLPVPPFPLLQSGFVGGSFWCHRVSSVPGRASHHCASLGKDTGGVSADDWMVGDWGWLEPMARWLSPALVGWER